MKKILIIDDEKGILEVIKAYFLKAGFDVYISDNGKKGYKMFNDVKPDIVVLDLMLPDMSGEEICENIRRKSMVPILMLTSKKEEADRIAGLELGADDYVVKPFSPKEVVIRVEKILSRIETNISKIYDKISFNNQDLVIKELEREVIKNNNKIEVTKTEFEILKLFAKNPDKTFTRENIIESALGYEYDGYDRTIDSYIKNLRKKIESDIKKPEYIVTVYGVGYKFKGELD